MYVACSSLCFGSSPLTEALQTIGDMNFQKVDLAIHEQGNHLKPSEVLKNVNKVATQLRKSNVGYVAFHAEIDAPSLEQYAETLKAICRLGRLLAVPLVNIPAAPLGSDMNEEVKRLTQFVKIASSEGLILTVETDSTKITANPQTALELCQRVPKLALTLDPSHYHVGPYAGKNYDALYPYIAHVRLRDSSAPDQLQVPVGQGEIEYGKIINLLARQNYSRALSVDIREVHNEAYPHVQEVRKLKYLLESMV